MRRNWKEVFRSQTERKHSKNRAKTGQKQGSVRFRSLYEISTLLRNQFADTSPSLRKFLQLQNHFWHTSATSQHSEPHFAAAKQLRSSKTWKFPISQPRRHLEGCFATAKPTFGTRVLFRSTVTLISQLGNGCKITKRKNFQFLSQSSISQGISKLRNHFLAHECHLEAPYTHFTAAKWLQNLNTLKSFSAHTMNRHVIAAPPFRQLLDTIRSLPEVQIMHAISHFKSWEVRSP